MKLPGIILVDDHRLFRSGIKYILESSGKYEIVGEAANGFEFLELLTHHKPELVIMDLIMPKMNGLEAARIALSRYPDLKILILSMFGQPEYYNALLDYGIKGYLMKDVDNEVFLIATDKIMAGEKYYAQELLQSIMSQSNDSNHVKLSHREKEILDLISHGLSNLQISKVLNISQRTVERHRTHLLEKTGSKDSVNLVIYALKNKLIVH
jgi:DNA-binding NarL/FixJ family response regulator